MLKVDLILIRNYKLLLITNYQIEHYLKTNNRRVIRLMNDELGGKIMTTFVGFRAKTYSYPADYGSEDKKAKSTKKYAIKRKF